MSLHCHTWNGDYVFGMIFFLWSYNVVYTVRLWTLFYHRNLLESSVKYGFGCDMATSSLADSLSKPIPKINNILYTFNPLFCWQRMFRLNLTWHDFLSQSMFHSNGMSFSSYLPRFLCYSYIAKKKNIRAFLKNTLSVKRNVITIRCQSDTAIKIQSIKMNHNWAQISYSMTSYQGNREGNPLNWFLGTKPVWLNRKNIAYNSCWNCIFSWS